MGLPPMLPKIRRWDLNTTSDRANALTLLAWLIAGLAKRNKLSEYMSELLRELATPAVCQSDHANVRRGALDCAAAFALHAPTLYTTMLTPTDRQNLFQLLLWLRVDEKTPCSPLRGASCTYGRLQGSTVAQEAAVAMQMLVSGMGLSGGVQTLYAEHLL